MSPHLPSPDCCGSLPAVTELAAWLTQIWDEDETRLRYPTFCGGPWPTTDQLLARIAADRQILALHNPAEGEATCGICCHVETPGTPHRTWEEERWPCATIRLLALPYADRSGYREEWRP